MDIPHCSWVYWLRSELEKVSQQDSLLNRNSLGHLDSQENFWQNWEKRHQACFMLVLLLMSCCLIGDLTLGNTYARVLGFLSGCDSIFLTFCWRLFHASCHFTCLSEGTGLVCFSVAHGWLAFCHYVSFCCLSLLVQYCFSCFIRHTCFQVAGTTFSSFVFISCSLVPCFT